MVQFFRDIYEGMRGFMVGMKVTGVHLKDNLRPDPRTVTTIPYNGTVEKARQVKVAPRFRGNLVVDTERCGGCKNCLRVCPVDCFWVETERTESGKQRVSRFDVDLLRCMYCGLCVMSCPTKCLTFGPEWGGAAAVQGAEAGSAPERCLIREMGKGFYTPGEKLEVERKRLLGEEARRATVQDTPPTPP